MLLDKYQIRNHALFFGLLGVCFGLRMRLRVSIVFPSYDAIVEGYAVGDVGSNPQKIGVVLLCGLELHGNDVFIQSKEGVQHNYA
jgi:hypothetical protein